MDVMSSHHFVRKGQEPALIIAGIPASIELFSELMQWQPVIVAEPGMTEVLGLYAEEVDVQMPVRNLLLEGRFSEILKLLEGENESFRDWHIVGLAEEEAVKMMRFPAREINACCFLGDSRIYRLLQGRSKWLPAKTRFKVHSPLSYIRCDMPVHHSGGFLETKEDGWIYAETTFVIQEYRQ